jgi:hypothetical protein
MLIKIKTIQGWKLESLDGDIGKVVEFYFDDRFWTVRDSALLRFAGG